MNGFQSLRVVQTELLLSQLGHHRPSRWLKQQTFFIAVEAGKSKIKRQGDLIIGEGALPTLQMAPSHYLLM